MLTIVILSSSDRTDISVLFTQKKIRKRSQKRDAGGLPANNWVGFVQYSDLFVLGFSEAAFDVHVLYPFNTFPYSLLLRLKNTEIKRLE